MDQQNEVAPAELVGMFVGMGLPAVIAAYANHSQITDPATQEQIAATAVEIGVRTLEQMLARFGNGG